MDLNNLILILALIGVNTLFYKHFLVILNKYNRHIESSFSYDVLNRKFDKKN